MDRRPDGHTTAAFIGIGSNIEPRAKYIERAVNLMSSHKKIEVAEISTIQESDWVDHVASSFGHLPSLVIAYQAVKVDGVKRNVVGEHQGCHNHPCYPKEQYVITRLHDAGREKPFKIVSLFGPTERGKGPKRGTEPGVENVRILVDVQ